MPFSRMSFKMTSSELTTPLTTCSAVYFRNPLLHGLVLIYRPWKDERLSRVIWLIYCEQFTHKWSPVQCPAVSQEKDRENSPIKTDVLLTGTVFKHTS